MFGSYLKLVQDFPCCEALGHFVCQQLSALLVDLMELENCALLVAAGNGCRNGYQAEQHIRLACGTLSLRRPRLRGQASTGAGYLKRVRGRKGFQEVPFLLLQGLACRELSRLGCFLEVPADLWREAELLAWARLNQWRGRTLTAQGHHCLVLERLCFGPDLPQLLVAMTIDQRGQAQVLDAQPGDASSDHSWSELCRGLVQRSIPAPILVKGKAAQRHWPQATAI